MPEGRTGFPGHTLYHAGVGALGASEVLGLREGPAPALAGKYRWSIPCRDWVNARPHHGKTAEKRKDDGRSPSTAEPIGGFSNN